jgi:hypothetical protein
MKTIGGYVAGILLVAMPVLDVVNSGAIGVVHAVVALFGIAILVGASVAADTP